MIQVDTVRFENSSRPVIRIREFFHMPGISKMRQRIVTAEEARALLDAHPEAAGTETYDELMMALD